MGTLEVDKLDPQSGTALEIGTSGDTATVPSGVTLTVAGTLNVTGSITATDKIDSAHYAAGSIDLEHMSANSVDSDQYVDGSIDLAHMSANSIDSDQYVDGSIDLAHMSANSIDSDQYVDGSIDTAHIGATQVTGAKLAADVISAQTALTAEPADTDEFMVSDAGVLKRIDYSLIKGGGITTASQWRLTTDFTGTAEPIASNWEEVDAPVGFGILGSSITESSGIFTFPSTGYWWIQFLMCLKDATGSNTDYAIEARIYTTTNNSTYAKAATSFTNVGTVNDRNSCRSDLIFDVTNTSNDKIRFHADSVDSVTTVLGSSGENETSITFVRLGDT